MYSKSPPLKHLKYWLLINILNFILYNNVITNYQIIIHITHVLKQISRIVLEDIKLQFCYDV